MSLIDQILEKLEQSPGTKAWEMATEFGVDKKQVNSFLFGRLKGKVRQDNQYRWYLAEAKSTGQGAESSQYTNTALSKLARYYLACMGQDEGGVSVFAANQYNDLDYCELDSLPVDGEDVFQSDAAQQLLGKLRKDRSRLVMYLGYPSTLKLVQSRKSNWSGYFVEPVLLFSVEFESGNAQPHLNLSFPIINRSVLQRFTNTEREALVEELVQLENELGLSGESEPPELDELVQRLASIRPEWPWREACYPDALVTDPPLSDVRPSDDLDGVYNRAVLVVGERSPYTQGLENELKQLAQLPAGKTNDTALGDWLKGKVAGSTVSEATSLVEVLPLNGEQRTAIRQALSKSLSVITGPPGTGKSQVVTDLLINAAWQGKRVLFASKNNKAVDVVETRVNNLGPRPILLRVGSNLYQTRLAEYLIGLLSATTTPEDLQDFKEAESIHKRLEERLQKLEMETAEFIKTRNTVDELEQSVEEARGEFSTDEFDKLKTLDIQSALDAVSSFNKVLQHADLQRQSIIYKLFWGFVRKDRYKRLVSEAESLETNINPLGLRAPHQNPDDQSISQWLQFGQLLEERLGFAEQIIGYLRALKILQLNRSLEELNQEQAQCLDEMASNASLLWKTWLRLQPGKLAAEDRQLLNKYNTLLKMVIDTGSEGRLSKKVYGEYHGLFPKMSHLLPCWAVTSLSARGKLPFQPGFFDLVIFDEASQCDIASALPLLYRAKRAVVIGDPKQLSHISGLQKGQDQQLLDKFDLIGEYVNWAYSYNSLFDLAAGLVSGEGIVSLRDHHRSHADIIGFSNKFFYEGRLRVATRYDELNRPSGKGPGVRWLNVPGQVQRPGTGGAVNHTEAVAVVEALRRLVLEQGYTGSVGVVSPFRAQANLIRQVVNKEEPLAGRLLQQDFLVDTVHKFQGDERDVMLFSPVLSDGISPGALSFMRYNGNLFNVAITRARSMLLVVGDQQAAAQCDIEYLAEFAKYCQRLAVTRESEVERGIEDIGPDYPSVSNPEQVSDWERLFYRALYKAGIKTLPQYRVEKYALDLALFTGERCLDIEVDGERYHRNWTGELCRRDQLRNQRMFELGWDVMRFWVYEIRDDLGACVERVQAWMERESEE